MKVSHARVCELLAYDPESGVLKWRIDIRSGRRKNAVSARAGAVAGSVMQDGYLRVGIDGRQYLQHILIWFIVKCEWPKLTIDHEDTNRQNNRWGNLRDVTRGMNTQNQRHAQADNKTSGLLGVSFDSLAGKYRARIWFNGKNRSLGMFIDKHEAHAAYVKAKRELHPGCTL